MKNITKMAPCSCYCGQSGDMSLNMLECAKCRRWLHEECVKCLDLPMLLGDRFYTFICSVCNAGSECIGRLELEWEEVVHLILYNLTIIEKKKYYHLDKEIMPFLQDNWERFQFFGQIASEKKDARIKVLQTLEKCQSRFKCGREVKKCKSLYALRIRVPPTAPSALPIAARLKKDVVVWDFQVKDRAYHILAVKKSTKNKENHKNDKHRSKLHPTSSARQKNGEVSKCRESLPHNENGIHKAKHKNKRTITSFNEDSARTGLLDSLIPFPPNFNNCNNPFLKCLKKSSSKRHNTQNNKDPPIGAKRLKLIDSSSELTFLNGNSQIPDESIRDHSSTPSSTKEDNLQRSKNEDFCIVGKRISLSGKVQYLFQRNR